MGDGEASKRGVWKDRVRWARRPVVLRLTGFVVAVVAFLSVASIIDPDESSARVGKAPRSNRLELESQTVAPGDTAAVDAASVMAAAGSLGQLESRDGRYRVLIHGGSGRPLYTVMDESGKVLVERGDVEQVYEAVPELDLRDLVALTVGEVEVENEH